MIWTRSTRGNPEARAIADRHYNRQKVGATQFVPPGRCVVLLAPFALWVTSWPFAEYVKHAWPGAWMCSCFRREGGDLQASEMIRQACSATRAIYGDPPALGMVSFIDPKKVKPVRVRGRDVWGWTWIKAGFEQVGKTKGGLLAFQLYPDRFPPPCAPLDAARTAEASRRK